MLAVGTTPKQTLLSPQPLVASVSLIPTEAVKLGKTVALSNKEVLVPLVVMAAAKKPVANCCRLWTASTTPFINACAVERTAKCDAWCAAAAADLPFAKRRWPILEDVSPEQALAHPNWKMGNRIAADSATMMNEVSKSSKRRWLFGMQPDQIDVVIHPSPPFRPMVSTWTSSILAQLEAQQTCECRSICVNYPESGVNQK